jgi:hypothetical protein
LRRWRGYNANEVRPIIKTLKALTAIPFLITTASFPQSRVIDGEWLANAIVTTGISADSHWKRISPLIGTTIQVDGARVLFATGETCELGIPSQELWANGMATFGSGGGNWAQIGLKPAENGENFEVIVTPIQCDIEDRPQLALVTQASKDILLLGASRVFATLRRNSN